MPESTYPTIGHGQINAFIFPIKATTSWTGVATVVGQFAEAQVNRLTTLGLGAFDLALRKRFEVGRTAATEKVASSAVDKPATLEWLDHGNMRTWNLLAGKAFDQTADITQADFDATSSECCLVVHKLDDNGTNVIESDILWRCVVDTVGISIPNSQDDDVRVSVRLTGDEHVMATNAAGKALCFLESASSGIVTIPAAGSLNVAVERDDWPDDDDGTNERTVCIADEAAAATVIDVYSAIGFSAGHDVVVRSSPTNWETTTVASVAANAITTVDAMANNHVKGAEFSRTRGFFLFVYNQTSGAYLEHGTDYRVRNNGGVLTIINVDGGSAIGASDEIWSCWLVASGAEIWTDNDSYLYGVTHPMTQFMVSPEAAFVTTTVGWNGTAVSADTEVDFTLPSGTNDDQEWLAVEFTAAGTGKIDNFVIPLTRATAAGTSAGELIAELYTDNGASPSLPSARRGNPSQPVRVVDLVSHASGATTIASARETFYFTDGPGVTSGTVYWAVLKTAGVQVATGVTSVSLLLDANGEGITGVSSSVTKADPNLGASSTPTWTLTNTSHSADFDVNLVGAQEVKRIQGMDMSITFSRSAFFEMGSETTIERSFDETDVRITIPKMMSDNTSWSRLIDKNTTSVKTARPEQNPIVWCRLEEYSTTAKNAGDIALTYEFPSVQRSGGEKTSPANERSTERITMTGDTFAITTAL